MSEHDIKITVIGEDRASSVLGEIATGALRRLGETAVNVAAGGVGVLFDALKDGIGDAREAAQIMAQTEAVIKSTGGAAGESAQQVADLASSLSAAAGKSLFGDDQIQSAENMLLTFTNIGKDVFPRATQATLDMAAAFKTTPEAFDQMIGKALNSADGFTALKRSGVEFTDSQEKMIKRLFETGDAAGAQRIILGELEKEFGGSAEAAAKADGGWAQFKDRMGEAAETVGGAVLPILNRLFSFLNTSLAPAIERAAQTIANILPVLAEVASGAYQWGVGLARQYAAGIASAASYVISVIQQLGSMIASWLRPHSPPRILPDLDLWGKKTAEVWLSGFGQADLSGVQELGNAVAGVLRGLASSGQFDEAGIIPAVLGSEQAIADAISSTDQFGSISEEALQKIVEAAGPAGSQIGGLVRNFFDLRRATAEVERAQSELNRVTQDYADRLSPLNAELRQIQDQKRAIDDQIRIKKLQEEIADGKTDELTRQKDLLEIQEITKRQQIDAVERERDTSVDAAQQKLQAAQQVQQAAERSRGDQQASLALYNQQNQLIGEQVGLLKRIQEEAAQAAKGAGGGGGGISMPAVSAPDLSAVTQPMQQMGQAMADVKTRAAEMRAAITDSFNGIVGKGREVVDFVLEFAPTFQILRGVVEAAVPPIKDIVLTTFGIISGFLNSHGATMLADVTQVWQGIQGLISAVLPPIQSIVSSVFGAIAIFLHAHGADIQSFLAQTWDAIAAIVKIAVALVQAIIVPIFTAIAGFLKTHGDLIQSILGNAWQVVKSIIDGALTLIRGVLQATLQGIHGDWSGAWGTIQTMSARFVQDLYNLIVHGLDLIANFFGTSLEGLKKTWTGNWHALVEIVGKIDWKGIGISIIDGMTGGVLSRALALADTVVNAIRGALRAAKEILKTGSPSRTTYEEIGLPMMEGAMKGIKDKEGEFSAALQHAFTAGGTLSSMGNAAAEAARRAGLSSDYIEHQTEAIKASEQQLSYLQQQAKLVDLIKDNGLDAKAILGDIKLGLNADPAALLEAMKNALSGLVQKTGEQFGVTPFASGVRNFAGGLALVGERGPELIGLPRGSNVYSNSESRSMGTTVNIYFQPGSIVGAQGQSVEQLAEAVIRKLSDRINLRRT